MTFIYQGNLIFNEFLSQHHNINQFTYCIHGGLRKYFSRTTNIDRGLEKLGGATRFDETKTIDWCGLLPGPFYTPEISAGVGIALVGLYLIDKK